VAADEQQPAGGEPGAEQMSQEELRAKLEEQLRNVRVHDVLLESVASILNLTARRIAKADERDLEQAKLGIDAARAVVDLLEPEPRQQVQQALSELQMLYAREAGGGAEGGGAGEAPESKQAPPPKPDSGLWTPPGSS
jgi:hypothetical protein